MASMLSARNRAAFLTRLTLAADRQANVAPQPERERNRYLWHFLAWSFIVGDGLGFDGFRAGKAIAAGDDDDSAAKAPVTAPGDPVSAGPGEATEAASTGNDDNTAAKDLSNVPANAVTDLSAEGSAGGYFAKAPSAGGVYNSGGVHTSGAIGGGAGGYSTATTASFDGPQLVLPLYTSDITFFEGLSKFSETLGFTSDPFSMASDIGAGASGPVMAALSFAEHPLTAVPVWQVLGGMDDAPRLSTSDGFSVDWVVQASGFTSFGQSQFTASHGVNGGNYTQSTHDATAGMGNEAFIDDGHDWDGTLWVTGNYYEFNTIIQVNVLWDRDTISVERKGSDEAMPIVGQIDSGNNVQHNSAAILEAEDLNTRDQLIMGGRDQKFATVQLNSIIDVDDIAFDLDDVLHGINVPGLIDGFGDVNSGGHEQSNASLMMSGGDFEIHMVTPERFFTRHKDDIKLVNGNFYEFNTIVQINVVNDANEIRSIVDGHLNTASDVIASGGNIQFNKATIFSNDNDDSLFVGGRYTQYNLALQINTIDDSDSISQHSQREFGLANGGDHGNGHIDGTLDGDDGVDGASLPAVNVAVPSVIDDMLVRGHDALV